MLFLTLCNVGVPPTSSPEKCAQKIKFSTHRHNFVSREEKFPDEIYDIILYGVQKLKKIATIKAQIKISSIRDVFQFLRVQ